MEPILCVAFKCTVLPKKDHEGGGFLSCVGPRCIWAELKSPFSADAEENATPTLGL